MHPLSGPVLTHNPVEQVQAEASSEPDDCLMLLPVKGIHTTVL